MPDDPAPDAFEALRRPDAPIAPEASFARRLREQLTAALQPLLDTNNTTTTTTTRKVSAMTVIPYLMVRNAAAALDFYRDAFGAVERQRLVGDDGRIGHAEFVIGDSLLMMADEYPEIGALGPESRGGPTCSFSVEVDDVDAAHALAVSFGATTLREPADQFHGSRSATISDPFGHNWTLTKLVENLTAQEYEARAAQDNGHGSFAVRTPGAVADETDPHHQSRRHDQGDLYYFTLPVADVARAQRFFGAVLGWQFDGPDQGHVANIAAPPGSVSADGNDIGARLWFVVDDIHVAVERVRAAGGSAQEPVEYPSGWSSDCTDDQGTVFSLSVPSAAYSL